MNEKPIRKGIGNRVTNAVDKERTIKVPERKIHFKLRVLLYATLFLLIFGALSLVMYNVYLDQNPRVSEAVIIYLDDPRYEGLEGWMTVKNAQGDGSDDLVTVVFTGEIEGSFFDLRAQK